MRCQQCTAENPEGLNFCNQCGAQLGARCPKCGFGNAPGAKFCGECGAQLTSRLSDALSKTAAVAEQGPRDRVVVTKSRLLRTHALVASFRGESCRGEICQSETDRRRRRSSRTRHRHFLRLRQVWRKHQYRGGASSRGGNRAREGSENGVQKMLRSIWEPMPSELSRRGNSRTCCSSVATRQQTWPLCVKLSWS
jgi:hypothetical protein